MCRAQVWTGPQSPSWLPGKGFGPGVAMWGEGDLEMALAIYCAHGRCTHSIKQWVNSAHIPLIKSQSWEQD